MGVLPSSTLLPLLPFFSISASLAMAVSSLASMLSHQSSSSSSSAAGVGAAAGATMVLAGGYFGEGLLPAPEKLVKKILKFEFIEMYELLPETWLQDEDESGKGLVGLPHRKSAPVTNNIAMGAVFRGDGWCSVKSISSDRTRSDGISSHNCGVLL